MMSVREWLDGFAGDMRYGIRGLRREPLFSGFAVLTLALGIGANAAMFGIVDKLLLHGPAHVRDASRVVRLFWTMRTPAGNDVTTAAFDARVYANLEVESRAFFGIAMYRASYKGTLIGQGSAARLVSQASATSNFMSVLGAEPQIGRFFTRDEQESPEPPRVAVLGYGLWQSDFGGRSDIVGRTVTISSRPYTVVGVAPRGFTGADLDRVDLWLPLTTKAGPAARHWGPGHMAGPGIVARLKTGVSFEQATADATEAYRRTYDGGERQYAEASVSVGPLHYGPGGTESTTASISRWLAGVSVVVLLVACVNIINLLLARAIRRRREMAVRIALGAGRARLLRLLLASSLVLAMLGSAAGLLVALAAGSVVRRVLLPEVDWTSGPVDGRVLGFSLIVAVVTGVAIGLLPALRSGRGEITAALKTGAREGAGHRSMVRSALMMTQAALAMLLLVGAGLFVRSLERVRSLDLGVQPERVVWLRPRWPRIPEQSPADERAREEQRREDFARAVLSRLSAAPEVEHAAATIAMPFGTAMAVTLAVPGWDSLPHLKGGFSDPDISAVSADYFATMGTRLLRGRVFGPADRAGSEPVAIVSETMARVLWPGRDAIGQCLLVGGKAKPCSRVVGVVQDARRSQIREDPFMHYYVPLGQQVSISGPELVVRPRGNAANAMPALQALVRRIDPSITFVDAGTLQDRVEPQTRSWRIGAMMFSLFAVLALVVAAVGMFSVVAYLVEQRRHEIGVRVALGAQSSQVVGLMLRGAVGITLAGVAIGAGLAIAGGPLAEPLLFETSARDPVVIGGVAAALIIVSVVASAVPALRARLVDPMTALRDE
jgi:predicted permease